MRRLPTAPSAGTIPAATWRRASRIRAPCLLVWLTGTASCSRRRRLRNRHREGWPRWAHWGCFSIKDEENRRVFSEVDVSRGKEAASRDVIFTREDCDFSFDVGADEHRDLGECSADAKGECA